jgi:hypothetical protein
LTRAVDQLVGSTASNDGEANYSGNAAFDDAVSEHFSRMSDTLISYSKEAAELPSVR